MLGELCGSCFETGPLFFHPRGLACLPCCHARVGGRNDEAAGRGRRKALGPRLAPMAVITVAAAAVAMVVASVKVMDDLCPLCWGLPEYAGVCPLCGPSGGTSHGLRDTTGRGGASQPTLSRTQQPWLRRFGPPLLLELQGVALRPMRL